MISHRNISVWPDRLEDVYDDVETDEPWFKNLDPEGVELFQGEESSLYRPQRSRPHAMRSTSEDAMKSALRLYSERLGRGCDPVGGSKILSARSATKPRSSRT